MILVTGNPIKEKTDNFSKDLEYSDIKRFLEYSDFSKQWLLRKIKKWNNINFRKICGGQYKC